MSPSGLEALKPVVLTDVTKQLTNPGFEPDQACGVIQTPKQALGKADPKVMLVDAPPAGIVVDWSFA